jgi:hypothetical protein
MKNLALAPFNREPGSLPFGVFSANPEFTERLYGKE